MASERGRSRGDRGGQQRAAAHHAAVPSQAEDDQQAEHVTAAGMVVEAAQAGQDEQHRLGRGHRAGLEPVGEPPGHRRGRTWPPRGR